MFWQNTLRDGSILLVLSAARAQTSSKQIVPTSFLLRYMACWVDCVQFYPTHNNFVEALTQEDVVLLRFREAYTRHLKRAFLCQATLREGTGIYFIQLHLTHSVAQYYPILRNANIKMRDVAVQHAYTSVTLKAFAQVHFILTQSVVEEKSVSAPVFFRVPKRHGTLKNNVSASSNMISSNCEKITANNTTHFDCALFSLVNRVHKLLLHAFYFLPEKALLSVAFGRYVDPFVIGST
ncbi:hypothetical protein PsorP6_012094 [Peronosclerospora sorghi]|uniref:Uncharacterized protein n=1 Tax=Peronosclerospora sorghi TaxID=230839 RepID=A0ACC0WI90_9STRA|nr:hypothetical protein PsorP6_012094 [Peronosclerospora sorghi]